MANRRKKYKQFEQAIAKTLAVNGLVFVLYLISAGTGVIWLKVTTTLICLAISGYCLYVLYASNELLRRRSLWMTMASAGIAICVLFSLLLNFPSPKPF